MQKLEGQEMLSTRYQSEYMRTHPVTRERVQAMQSGLLRADQDTKTFPEKWQEQFLRMQAKIQAYTDPSRAKGDFGRERDTMRGQYALAIVDYRQGRLGDAQTKVRNLISKEPKNPYFHELMGQIEAESGQVDAAIESYETALKHTPNASLVRLDLAQAYIQKAGQNDRQMLKNASRELMAAAKQEARTPRLHRLAATVQGRLGNDGYAQLHLAEEAVLQRDFGQARRFAKRAEAIFGDQKNSSGNGSKNGGEKTDRGAWLRTQDILQYLDNKKD
jgi:predicted Zn-dependent protease